MIRQFLVEATPVSFTTRSLENKVCLGYYYKDCLFYWIYSVSLGASLLPESCEALFYRMFYAFCGFRRDTPSWLATSAIVLLPVHPYDTSLGIHSIKYQLALSWCRSIRVVHGFLVVFFLLLPTTAKVILSKTASAGTMMNAKGRSSWRRWW